MVVGKERPMTTKTYKGGCHCGSLAFEADIDLAQGTAKCNCSFCTKTRAWKAFVKPAAFRLLTDVSKVGSYHKHELAPLKHFCPRCSVYTHETGNDDYRGGAFVGVFISALDNVEPQELVAAPVRFSDGRNNNWGSAPAETRYL
jgi:hypothetical protein